MKISVRRILKGASLFGFLALCIVIVRLAAPGGADLNVFIHDYILSQGVWGYALFVLMGGVLTCFGFPRQVLAFVGGYTFGALWGTLWATLGAGLGCVLAFSYARFVAQASVEKRFARQVQRVNNAVAKTPFVMTICIRLLPIGNNLLTCLVAGVSKIGFAPFVLGSLLGYIPQNFIFALLGSGVRVDPVWRTVVSGILFVLSSILGWYIYKKIRK